MSNFFQRLGIFAIEEDEAINGLAGGRRGETISGSCGRGLMAKKWWAPAAVFAIEALPFFSKGHCLAQAQAELDRRSKE